MSTETLNPSAEQLQQTAGLEPMTPTDAFVRYGRPETDPAEFNKAYRMMNARIKDEKGINFVAAELRAIEDADSDDELASGAFWDARDKVVEAMAASEHDATDNEVDRKVRKEITNEIVKTTFDATNTKIPAGFFGTVMQLSRISDETLQRYETLGSHWMQDASQSLNAGDKAGRQAFRASLAEQPLTIQERSKKKRERKPVKTEQPAPEGSTTEATAEQATTSGETAQAENETSDTTEVDTQAEASTENMLLPSIQLLGERRDQEPQEYTDDLYSFDYLYGQNRTGSDIAALRQQYTDEFSDNATTYSMRYAEATANATARAEQYNVPEDERGAFVAALARLSAMDQATFDAYQTVGDDYIKDAIEIRFQEQFGADGTSSGETGTDDSSESATEPEDDGTIPFINDNLEKGDNKEKKPGLIDRYKARRLGRIATNRGPQPGDVRRQIDADIAANQSIISRLDGDEADAIINKFKVGAPKPEAAPKTKMKEKLKNAFKNPEADESNDSAPESMGIMEAFNDAAREQADDDESSAERETRTSKLKAKLGKYALGSRNRFSAGKESLKTKTPAARRQALADAEARATEAEARAAAAEARINSANEERRSAQEAARAAERARLEERAQETAKNTRRGRWTTQQQQNLEYNQKYGDV